VTVFAASLGFFHALSSFLFVSRILKIFFMIGNFKERKNLREVKLGKHTSVFFSFSLF
jgi:hypothetical protein